MFFRFLKVRIFGPTFNFKLSLSSKTMINSIKTLKSYCKATLNVFLKKNFLMMTKNFIYMIIFFVKLKFYCLKM